MRVDPDQTDVLLLLAIELGNASDCSGGNGMIAPQHQRDFACLERLHDQVRALGAGRGDFFQIFRVGRAFFLLFGDGD